MLYILVTAAPPFDGETDRQIMENIKNMKYSFNSISSFIQLNKQNIWVKK